MIAGLAFAVLAPPATSAAAATAAAAVAAIAIVAIARRPRARPRPVARRSPGSPVGSASRHRFVVAAHPVLVVGCAVGAVIGAALVGLIFRAHGLRTIAVALLVAPAAAPAPAAAATAAAIVARVRRARRARSDRRSPALAILGAFGLIGRRLIGDLVVGGARQLRARPLAVVAAAAAHALDLAIGGMQLVVGLDRHREAVALLDLRQGMALLVEQVERDVGRHADDDLARPPAHAFLLDGAQRMQRRQFERADAAGAGAMRADLGRMLEQGGPQPLARHLEQAEGRDAADLDAGAVVAHRILDLVLDLALVARLLHVDEVDHDQAGEVAQAHLAGDLLGRLDVGPAAPSPRCCAPWSSGPS